MRSDASLSNLQNRLLLLFITAIDMYLLTAENMLSGVRHRPGVAESKSVRSDASLSSLKQNIFYDYMYSFRNIDFALFQLSLPL